MTLQRVCDTIATYDIQERNEVGRNMTKIDIISGFLGAGKTTFIKKLLKEGVSGEQVVLIENEFGEIGIDGGFLKEAGVTIREMNSGCICCSLVGDFEKSLCEVLEKYHPDRVIIEPSGVGKLSEVITAVQDAAATAQVVLNSAVTLVDVSKYRMYAKNFGEFFNNQIESAVTVVLSRTDTAAAEKVEQVVLAVRERNPQASVVTTPYGELSGKQLLEIMEKPDSMEADLMRELRECGHGHGRHRGHGEGCGCGHGHGRHHGHEEDECGCGHEHGQDHFHHEHGEKESECGCGQAHAYGHDHHHADEIFTSWGTEHAPAKSGEELNKLLDELAYGDRFGEVLRAKGMIPGEEKGSWHFFDLVPEQYEIREGAPEYTGKVCVIGVNLKEQELQKAFGNE